MSRKTTIRKTATGKTGRIISKTAIARTKPAFDLNIGIARIRITGEPPKVWRYIFDRLFWLLVLAIIAFTVIALNHPGPVAKGAGMAGGGVAVGAGIKKIFRKSPT